MALWYRKSCWGIKHLFKNTPLRTFSGTCIHFDKILHERECQGSNPCQKEPDPGLPLRGRAYYKKRGHTAAYPKCPTPKRLSVGGSLPLLIYVAVDECKGIDYVGVAKNERGLYQRATKTGIGTTLCCQYTHLQLLLVRGISDRRVYIQKSGN